MAMISADPFYLYYLILQFCVALMHLYNLPEAEIFCKIKSVSTIQQLLTYLPSLLRIRQPYSFNYCLDGVSRLGIIDLIPFSSLFREMDTILYEKFSGFFQALALHHFDVVYPAIKQQANSNAPDNAIPPPTQNSNPE